MNNHSDNNKVTKQKNLTKKNFNKVLVANRGEIACRIIKTLHKLNIAAVAVYSEFDFNAPHVLMADEAVCIGRAKLCESYLNADNVIEAAIKTGSDALHPGFGFFAENAQFVKSLTCNNITFIGPEAATIELMSNKITAKNLAQDLGIRVVDGYMGEIKNVKSAIEVINKIGLPVLIKAAGGGGGKGMRIISSYNQIAQSVVDAQNEALKSFADGRIFIEKFIEKPRHIEIQIVADKHGNIVCLGERECSIQRRYQKVIEEAPSPFVTHEMREKMYAQSVKLIKGVGYYSVGTVEYIVDPEQNFYFMEMNTRIQVEHAITEMVTGIDIVEEMINIALDKKLTFSQKDTEIKGHALEARIYSENPEKGFLPTTGFITEYKEPTGENIRVDSGIREGIEISTHYDAMLAKICVHGSDRAESIRHMNLALEKLVIDGVVTNTVFLQSIFRHPNFINAETYTGFIADLYENGIPKNFRLEKSMIKVFIAVALYAYCSRLSLNFENIILENRDFVATILDKKINININFKESDLDFIYMNKKYHVRMNYNLRSTLVNGKINNDYFIARCTSNDLEFNIEYMGTKVVVRVLPQEIQAFYDNYNLEDTKTSDNYMVKSVITGIVSKIYVEPGIEVKKGDPLFIIESMKMENTFNSELFGKIARVAVKEGSIIQEGDLVLEYNQ